MKEGGPPGGMKGVKVTKGDGVGEGLQQTAPAKGGPLATRSASPPPAPPSTQPVELFLRESNTGRGVGGTGGGGPGLLPPRITTETAKNEIQWHTWRLECHIKKVAIITSQIVHSLCRVLRWWRHSQKKIVTVLGAKYRNFSPVSTQVFNHHPDHSLSRFSSSKLSPKAHLPARISRPCVASPLMPTG